MTYPQGRNTFDSSNTRHNIARIILALEKPQSYRELAAALFMTERSLQRYISHLRAEPNRRVYVKGHKYVNKSHIPILALGALPDAKKPRMTTAQYNAKRTAKVRASPELMERKHNYEVARWLVRRLKVQCDLICALFGRPVQKGAQP